VLDPIDVVGGNNDPCVRLPNQLRRGSSRGNCAKDRPAGCEILEELARGDVLPALADIRKKEQERVRRTLELEGALAGTVGE